MRRDIFFIVFLITVAINVSGCRRFDRNVPGVLAGIAESNDSTSLSEITKYEWDKVYVIGLYESFDYSVVKGVPRKVKKRLEWQELEEKWFVLLFTLNQEFVSCADVRRDIIDTLGLDGASVYTPETVIPLSAETAL